MKTTWGSREHADHVILLAGFTGPVALYSDVPTMPPLPVDEAAGVRRIVVNPRGYVITSNDRSDAKGFRVYAEDANGHHRGIKWDHASENRYDFTRYIHGARNLVPSFDLNQFPESVPDSIGVVKFLVCLRGEVCEVEWGGFENERRFEEATATIKKVYESLRLGPRSTSGAK